MTTTTTLDASAVSAFLTAAATHVAGSTFNTKCIQQLMKSNSSWGALGFVQQNGTPIVVSSTGTNDAIFGITFRSCDTYCGFSSVGLPFSYAGFVGAMTNYLLPWLALTAQLPYETGSGGNNLLALFIALGSPMLIAYSLSLTVMNIVYVRQRFRRLKEMDKISDDYSDQLNKIKDVLQTAQHVPLRANQTGGCLSSLLVLKTSKESWYKIKDYLDSHVRDFTPSALAQLLVAIIAWILTTVAGLANSLGDPDTALQNASGSLWLWLIPVVVGYIKVGVPNSSRVATKAFGMVDADKPNLIVRTSPRGRASPANDRLAPPARPDAASSRSASSGSRSVPETHELAQLISQQEPAQAIPAVEKDDELRCGLLTKGGWFITGGIVSQQAVKVLSRSVLGDADIAGAAYTYARSLQFPFLVELIADALQHSIFEDPKRVKLKGASAGDVAGQCGQWKVNMKINPFPSWTQISANSWYCMIVAAAVAFALQWGTLMASFELAYTTPVLGIGCRSGSYLIYGTISTLACTVLVVSQFLSNEAMRIEQEIEWCREGNEVPGSDPRPQPLHAPSMQPSPSQEPRRRDTSERENGQDAQFVRSWQLEWLKHVAVVSRVFGKSLCILNTVWLLTTSVCEIIGVFDGCWCAANRPTNSYDTAFVNMFKNAADLADQARSPWFGGFAMSLFFVISTSTFFWLGSSRDSSG